jgi:hypothetical protein
MTKKSVKDALIKCAINGQTVTYRKLIQQVELRVTSNTYPSLFKILTEIGEEEFKSNRPPINCLVVNEHQMPGPGFYVWYDKMFTANFRNKSDAEKEILLKILKEECTDYWLDVIVEAD